MRGKRQSMWHVGAVLNKVSLGPAVLLDGGTIVKTRGARRLVVRDARRGWRDREPVVYSREPGPF